MHGGTIVLAESLDDIEGAFQDAVAGRAAALPFADICIPSVFDPTLAPEGQHVVSMFTQWVPHTWAGEPHAPPSSRRTPTGSIARVDAVAPGFTDSILHRQVIGPYEMEHEYGLIGGNIFHGELSPDQLFHMRPAPGYADFRTPIAGLYQASSATHGGGGVTGIPALNVVRQIALRRTGASLGPQGPDRRRSQGAGSVTLSGRPSTVPRAMAWASAMLVFDDAATSEVPSALVTLICASTLPLV